MEKFSETDFAKIIDDCEIIILPDNASIEDALSSENLLNHQKLAAEANEDFEQSYWNSKAKRNPYVSVSFTSFSLLFCFFFFFLLTGQRLLSF